MPVLNELIGAYKTIKVNGKFILAEKATRSQTMVVQNKQLIQGTVKSRILEIGGIEENISIDAPILIGGGALIDGRTLLTDQIANILLRRGASLPLLETATVTVSEKGANVALKLKSDGSPAAEAFVITDHDSSALTDGTTSDVLNPSLHTPTRVANFIDFRVNLGGFMYYVMEGVITVKASIEKHYFVAGADGSTNNTTPIPDPNPYNFGTQYPFLAVASLEISGNGTAAVLLSDPSGTDYTFTSGGDSINYNPSGTMLTLQQPGYTNVADGTFTFEVYNDPNGNGSGATWVSLFRRSGAGSDLFDLSKSVVSRSDLDVGIGIIKTKFDFHCYVI